MDDPAYKRLLTHQRIVKDLLIGFIAPQRPSGWADAFYFETLREGPTENVTDELRRRLGDVVWSIDRRDGSGGVQTLHMVIEHQSSVDYSMPLRFLNYTSLLYQRLYHDRSKWRQSDTADAVLHVVVYNGDKRWDAPVTLAGLVERTEQDGAAHLALSYEVLDLVAVRGDDLPRSNLLRWVAEVEQSVQAGGLPERVRELGEWLAEAGEPGLTRTFDLWLGALGRKLGVELPSIREYEEASAVLAEKIDRWGAEILEQGIQQGVEQGIQQGVEQGIQQGIEQGVEQGVKQGIEQGNERQKALLRRQAERRFGPAAAERLSAVLAEVTDADRLAEAGEWIVDCATTAEFLALLDRSGS